MTKTRPRFQVVLAIEWMRLLYDEPMTSPQFARRVGVPAPQVARHLRNMHRLGLLRVSGWETPRKSAIYSVGDEPDAVVFSETGEQLALIPLALFRRRSVTKLTGLAVVWRALREPSTVVQLAEESGLWRTACSLYVHQLHKLGMVRIESWEIPLRSYARVPLFVRAWDGKDRPRPPALPEAELNRRAYLLGRRRLAQRRLTHHLSFKSHDRPAP